MNDDIKKLFKFFHLCERLKIEKRNGKTSDNEYDRVASHSWRLATMVLFISPYLGQQIDLSKALKISIIHDLPEIITGDQAYFHHMFNAEAKKQKEVQESQAMDEILESLPFKNRDELKSLWEEYEQQQSYEAKLVKALDKVEAQMQHNEADISVWNDYDRKYYDTFLNKFCNFDEALSILKQYVQEESKNKLENS